jgi:hypothetical protein
MTDHPCKGYGVLLNYCKMTPDVWKDSLKMNTRGNLDLPVVNTPWSVDSPVVNTLGILDYSCD